MKETDWKISPDAGRAFRGLPCFRLTYIQEVILMRRKAIRRGALFYADLDPVIGSEQGGTRPILILQNDVGNYFSPTVVAAAITSRRDKTHLPTHVLLEDVPGLALPPCCCWSRYGRLTAGDCGDISADQQEKNEGDRHSPGNQRGSAFSGIGQAPF